MYEDSDYDADSLRAVAAAMCPPTLHTFEEVMAIGAFSRLQMLEALDILDLKVRDVYTMPQLADILDVVNA